MEKKKMTLKTANHEEEKSCSNPEEIERVRAKFRNNYAKLSLHSHNPLVEGIQKRITVETDTNKIDELLIEKGKALLTPLLDLFSIATNSNIETKDEEPVITSSFAIWREEALKIFADLTKEYPPNVRKKISIYLIQKMDYEFLPLFIKKAWTRYALGINIYTFGVKFDPSVFSNEGSSLFYRRLVKAISKWLIHLELICDLTDRLKKYQILDYNNLEIFKKCKSKWKAVSDGIPMRHIIKSCTWNMALKLHEKFSSTLYSMLKTFAICNFPFTLTLGFGLLKALLAGTFASKAISYSVLGYVAVLVGGLITALTMHMGKQKLTDKKATEDIEVLIDCFKVTINNIKDLLRQANVLIIEIINSEYYEGFDKKEEKEDDKEKPKIHDEEDKEDEKTQQGKEEIKLKKEKIKEILEMLSEKKKPIYGYKEIEKTELYGRQYLIDYFKANLVDEDWVHVTKVNIEMAKINEEMVGSVLKLSLQPNN